MISLLLALSLTAPTDTIPVVMEVVRTDKASIKFYQPGVKIGDTFYIQGRKLKPIPKTWFVWTYKIISK